MILKVKIADIKSSLTDLDRKVKKKFDDINKEVSIKFDCLILILVDGVFLKGGFDIA